MPKYADINPEEFYRTINEKPVGRETTTGALLTFGICACDNCGNLTSIDYRYCKFCDEEIVILKR